MKGTGIVGLTIGTIGTTAMWKHQWVMIPGKTTLRTLALQSVFSSKPATEQVVLELRKVVVLTLLVFIPSSEKAIDPGV